MLTFVWLNFSSHLLLHCSRILRSCCSISWSFLFVMALNILMSSANINVLDLVKSGRLFMYKTNNKGPAISLMLLYASLIFSIYCYLLSSVCDECLYPVN